MRKLAVALLSIALIAISCVTALAAESPELPTETCTRGCSSPELPTETCTRGCSKDCDRRWGWDCRNYPNYSGYSGYSGYSVYPGYSGYSVYPGYQQVAYGGVMTVSPKTGVSDSDAIFAVLGVLACGSLAVVAKKKMSE